MRLESLAGPLLISCQFLAAAAPGADDAKPGKESDPAAASAPAAKAGRPAPKPGDRGGLKGSSDVLVFNTQDAAEEAIKASAAEGREFQATVSRLMRTKQAGYTPEYTPVEIKSVGPTTLEVLLGDGPRKGKTGFVYKRAFIDAEALAAQQARYQQLLQRQAMMRARGAAARCRSAPGACSSRHTTGGDDPTPSQRFRSKIHPRGFEPLTFGSVDRCSIQLSYGCNASGLVDRLGHHTGPPGSVETPNSWNPGIDGVREAAQPLMTPTGRSLATFFEMPALSTTSTTWSTSL